MAIATKLVADGVLVTTAYQPGVPNPYPVSYAVTARASDWFESFVNGTGPDQGKALSVSLAITNWDNAVMTNLALELFTGDDLLDWTFVTTLIDSGPSNPPGTPPITNEGIYSAAFTYPIPPTTVKKYFRIQFTLDENPNPGPQSLPYPTAGKWEGSCWVTVSN